MIANDTISNNEETVMCSNANINKLCATKKQSNKQFQKRSTKRHLLSGFPGNDSGEPFHGHW